MDAPPAVLVVSDPRGFVHASIPAAERALVALGPSLGRRVVLLPRASALTAARLRGARAVVFLDTTGDPPVPRDALLRFVRRGGGLVALHASTNGFGRWPAWGPLVGARFVTHPLLRRDVVTTTADVTTRGVPRRFVVEDEWYVHDRRPKAHVVARLGTQDRRPLAWRRREGRGRVFTTTLGHPDVAWTTRDPRLALVRSGLRWAAR